MQQISDYLVDWAEQLRKLAASQSDRKTQKKLHALADECGRVTLLMTPEREVIRLH
jgi:hypothetical protein